MTEMNGDSKREATCPIYNIKCPEGLDAALSCNSRMGREYNPISNFRDADIEFCAIHRREQETKELLGESLPKKHPDLTNDEG